MDIAGRPDGIGQICYTSIAVNTRPYQMRKRAENLADARDHPVMPPHHALWAAAADIILDAWLPRDDVTALRAGLVMALSFETWRALVKEQGLSQDQAVALIERLMGEWGG